MKRTRLSSQIKKVFPVILATSVLTACVGQEGDTNGGFAGVGGSGVGTALGIAGGVILAGALLAADDDDDSGNSTVAGAGDVATGADTDADGGADADADGGAVTDADGGADADADGGADADADGGADADADGGADADADGGADADADGGADADADGGADADADGGADADADGGADADADGGADADAGADTGTDTGTVIDTTADMFDSCPDCAVLASNGSFDGSIFSEETVPPSGSPEVATSDLQFDPATGNVTGCVTVPAGSTPAPVNSTDLSAVTIMTGPPGAVGFPAVELEPNNADRTLWCVPAVLSDAQRNVIQQSLLAGNLYLAVRNNDFPDGLLRGQITTVDTFLFSTTTTCDSGSVAEGFVTANELTGDYAITWNTNDTSVVSADLNDGVTAGASENVILALTQRASNPTQFFAFGNFLDPNDPVPNLETLLNDGVAHLDAHNVNGDRVCEGLLTKQ